MLVSPDTRHDYGEPRWIAFALLDVVPVMIAYTERGERVRIISVRKAHKHERKILEAYLRFTEGNG